MVPQSSHRDDRYPWVSRQFVTPISLHKLAYIRGEGGGRVSKYPNTLMRETSGQVVRTFCREDGHTEINSVGLLLEERLADAILNDHTSRKVGRLIGDDHPI
ncbi:hypothetical protein J6590_051482 [Homalodisca vitripennis]|nr:hypothetical protein J6590_051482 [Homalodisca vitripennis]